MNTTHIVHAKRWTHGWELHIEGVGVTQSNTLSNAADTVREYVGMLEDRDASGDTVELISDELPDDVNKRIADARRAAAELMERQRTVGANQRAIASDLVTRCGLKGADVAALLGVSPQRASQLIND